MTVSNEIFYAEIMRRLALALEEVEDLKARLEDVSRDRDQSAANVASLEKQNAQLQADRHRGHESEREAYLEKQLTQLQHEMQEVQQLRGLLEEAKVQVTTKDRELVQCQADRDSLKGDNGKLRVQFEKFRVETAAEASRVCEEMQSKIMALKNSTNQQEQRYQAETSRMLELLKEKTTLELRLSEARAQVSEAGQRAAALEKEKLSLSNMVVAFEGHLKGRGLREKQLQAELDASKSRELELAAKCAAQHSKLTEMQSSVSDLQPEAVAPRVEAGVQSDVSAQSITATQADKMMQLAPSEARSLASMSIQTEPQVVTIRVPPLQQPATPTRSRQPRAVAFSRPVHGASVGPLYAIIPESRRLALEAFSAVPVPHIPEDILFSRGELSSKLGGGMQGVDGAFGKRKPLAVKFDLHGCIYPQRSTNPWLLLIWYEMRNVCIHEYDGYTHLVRDEERMSSHRTRIVDY